MTIGVYEIAEPDNPHEHIDLVYFTRPRASGLPALPDNGEGWRWVGGEERGFGLTLDRGTELLGGIVANARAAKTSWVEAADAFELHDTYGFP